MAVLVGEGTQRMEALQQLRFFQVANFSQTKLDQLQEEIVIEFQLVSLWGFEPEE